VNRVYQLVWNRALRVVQVTSELSSSNHGLASGSESTAPRLRLLWGAMLATGLWAFGAPAIAQVCQPTDTRACSAQGGAPTPDFRAGGGGAGNGQGGGAVNISGFTPIAGGLPSIGNGGAGATGADATNGGAGGGGGALGTDAAGIWAGGRGVDGADALRTPGGGGGGGAGMWTAATSLNFVAGNMVTGGDGGNGGSPAASSAAGGGGGGGGGTGLAGTADGFTATIQSGASIIGGDGGAGGSQATGPAIGGGGGGGGDGLLLFGANANIDNSGTIRGGAGGAGGVSSINGNAGDAGAGINALNTGLTVTNRAGGTIQGGAGTGNGAAGIGIITRGDATLTNAGTIAGGLAAGAPASAVLFNGTGNELHLQTGSIIQGALEVADGGAATVISAASNSIDAVKLDGNTLGAQVMFETDATSPGALEVKSITGTGDVNSQGNNAPFTFDHIDIDGSVTLNHVGVTGLDGSIISTGAQAFVARLTLLGDSSLQSQSTIGVSSTIDGAHALVISTPAALALNGNIGAISSLASLTSSSATLAIKGVRAGAIDLTTTGGAITQGGAFNITGTSTFNAGAHDVLLSSANSFGGNVTATGNNITIHAASDLAIGGITSGAAGNISLASDGVLTLPTNLTTTGNISLVSNGGAFSQTAQLHGGSIALAGNTGVTLANSVITPGTLTINTGTGGDALQVGNSVSAGELAANVSGTLSLTSVANAIQTLGDISANTFVFSNAIASTVTGDVSAQSIQFNAPQGVTVIGSVDGGTGTGTLLNASTSLTVGNGGTTGTLSGNVTDNGVLAFDRSDTVSFADTLAGSGQLVQKGSGTLLFDGDASTFAGSTQVQAGTLIVGGTAGSTAVLAGNVDVAAGAALGGHGSIDGNVSLANGSVLSPGHSIGTLSVNGDLSMAQGSSMDVELGAAGAGDKVAVDGNLALNGVTVNVSDVGGMGPGVYTIFSYTGALTETNGGLSFGTKPAGHTLQLVTLLGNKQINILDVSNTTLNFWNANGLASGAQMGGGNGTWSTTSSNWTDAVGSITGTMTPQPGLAVFGGTPGTVTVDGTDGQVAAEGLQFLTDGYHMTGDSVALTWSSGTPVIRVGDGSESTAGYVATIDNVLTGTQGLAKNDVGTLVLNGANTYTGETIVNGGTLSVSDDGNLGAAANGVTLNGGALRVTGAAYNATIRALTLDSGGAVDIADAANAFAWNGAIVGNGALEKRGAGTLVLDHANAYTGGTLVTQGTLRLGDSGAIGSGALALADGTTLDLAADGLALSNAVNVAGTSTVNVNASDAATLSGVIADGASAGSLTKNGAGELRLTGNNTYTGTTTIAAGTLHIGDGGTAGSVTGDIVDHGTLILDRSDDVTYAGALSGEGSFRKLGSSALHLTGDSSAFTGSTEVTAGTLQLDGKLGGDLSMASGTVLSGTGTGGNVVLQSGAEISPAGQGTTGTLAFTGDLTMATGTRYTVDVTDTGNGDRLNVAGHASLQGGSVVSLGTGGNWNTSTTYTILSATNGVTGTFGSVSTDLAFLTPSLAYTANAVNLTLARNAVAFPDVAVTRNERATASAVEALGAGAVAYDAILHLDAADARAGFDSLSGEIHASVRTAIADDQRYQREAINNHLLDTNAAGESEGVTAWVSTWGHWGNYDGDSNAARTNANGSGLLVGADTVVGQSTRVGFALGTGQISASASARDASADVRTHTAGLYAGGREGAFQWQAGALYGQQKISTHRSVAVGDVTDNVGSEDDGHAAQGYVEGAYVFDGSRGSWAPFVNVAYQQLRTPTIHEHGSFSALDIDSDRSSQTFGTLGLRGEIKLADGGAALFGSVGWRHAWGDVDSTSRMRFADGGTAFDIQGVPIAANAGTISAGLRFRPSPTVTIDATYSGQFASDAKDQAARLSLSWAF